MEKISLEGGHTTEVWDWKVTPIQKRSSSPSSTVPLTGDEQAVVYDG
jgi:hypothetical protein